MTNEEMERMMQFILEQQAQSTVKVDRLAENVNRFSENVNRLADAQLKYEARTGRLEESFLILVQLAQSTDKRLDNADPKMSEVVDKMGEFSDKMNALTDAQIRTDENIRNLTVVVDRYFSEGRNGKP